MKLDKPVRILGISAYYHDAAAALLQDGHIVAAAQEERFSRRKHDPRFPRNAVRYCLSESGIRLGDVDYIVFYDKPLVKFERLLETYLAYTPKGFLSFLSAMPVWIKEKLYLKSILKKEFSEIGSIKKKNLPPLMFSEHHQAHAASAYYPGPYSRAAILCLDGVGEWATTSAWQGRGNLLSPLWEIDFPHSLGLLYSAFTYYTGFKVNSGEYKVMGLAPYGEPRYVNTILDHLVDLKPDGTFRLNMDYFGFATGLTMTNKRFDHLLGGPPRLPESPLTQREMDIARSIQDVCEEIMLRLAQTVHRDTGERFLCLAGGVALNCVGNGRILREGPFDDIWIQPAAGDAGGALGAALAVWHEYLDMPQKLEDGASDGMQGAFLGPAFDNQEVKKRLDMSGAVYSVQEDNKLLQTAAELISEGKVIGWFQGRMEFGPRALGGRSIIGDPRSSKMQSLMNLKIKYRESFRPFAPSVLAEDVSEYFDLDRASPYMLIVSPVLPERRIGMSGEQEHLFGLDRLKVPRSDIPAVTHVDYTARVQTVHKDTNPRYYALLKRFSELTGCSVLVNTSFNVRGEPIVCSPEDAYRCFMRTEMDYLVIENFLLAKGEQPPWKEDRGWMNEFEPD